MHEYLRRQLEVVESRTEQLLRRGEAAQALAVAKQAAADAASEFGDAHPHSVNLNDLLATLHVRLGDIHEAIRLREHSLGHKREALGPDERVAQDANNLAELYRQSNQFLRARALYLEALAIHDHPVIWNNLGLLYHATGAPADAERCIRHCLEADLQTHGADHPNTATTQDSLAAVLMTLAGDTDDDIARQRRDEALALMDNAQRVFRDAEMTEPLLRCLANRVTNFVQVARVSEAVAAGVEADTLATVSQPDSALHVSILQALGEAYAASGDGDRARATYARAMGMSSDVVERAALARGIAIAWFDQRNDAEAAPALLEALELAAQAVFHRVGLQSEGQRAHGCRELWALVERLLSIALRTPGAVSRTALLQAVLRGQNLHGDVERHFVDTASSNIAAQATFHALRAHQRSMVETALRGPGVEISPFRDEVEEQDRQAMMLEGELAASMADGGGQAALAQQLSQWWRTITVSDIVAALPRATALLIYAAACVRLDSQQEEDHYVALSLCDGDEPGLIDLGTRPSVEALIQPAVDALNGPLRDVSWDGAPEAIPDVSPALTAQLLQPLLEHHTVAEGLIVVPDGMLWSVPFDALPLDEDKRVADRYATSIGRHGRDLLRFGQAPGSAVSAPIVVGDPTYALGGPTYFRESAFARLTGTRDECRAVAGMLGASAIEGKQATKHVVATARSPSILHLATHGVYDLERNFRLRRFSPMPWRATSDALIGPGFRERTMLWDRNPMYRSMLIFAGASDFLDGHDLPEHVGNGILTAAELSLVDLRNTELAVLSACSTLRGDTSGGAVRGLSSALSRAGARCAVLSLWPVPDKATAMLMSHFYRQIRAGQGRADALRSAKRTLRNEGASTWEWAAFVCVGDPGPLDGAVLDGLPPLQGQHAQLDAGTDRDPGGQ